MDNRVPAATGLIDCMLIGWFDLARGGMFDDWTGSVLRTALC